MGYPAYTGMVPSTMVTNALITTREAVVAGDAAWRLHADPQDLLAQPFLRQDDVSDWRPRKAVALDLAVRSALLDAELLRSVSFHGSGPPNTHASLYLNTPPAAADVLVRINRPDDIAFQQQLKLMDAFAALRAERTAEILTQVVPQTAHWSAVLGLQPAQHRYTWELIGAGLRFAMVCGQQFKFHFNVLRAWRYSAAIQPMILTPGHAAFPSGHAIEACFVAELLPLLVGDPSHPGVVRTPAEPQNHRRPDGLARQLNRLALRIAENRVVAGLHYPVDTIAGQALGVMLARWMVWLACDKPDLFDWDQLKVGAVAFPDGVNGATAQPDVDGFVDEQDHIGGAALALGSQSRPSLQVLQDLWILARREWVQA